MHLPDLQTPHGMMSLLSLCVLVFLGNVLDFRTYAASVHHQDQPLTNTEKWLMMEYDINSLPTNERLAICYCRGVATHLFKWVRECCVIHGPDGSVVEDLPLRFLSQISSTILRYKMKAEEKNLEGVTNCSLALLTAQINNVMRLNEDIHEIWTSYSDRQFKSLELEDQAQYQFKWKAGWETSAEWSSDSPGKFLSILQVLL